MMATTKTTARDVTGEIAFLTRALKAPTLRESVGRLADRARSESWTHEEFLAACLQREVAARESHGGEGRIRAARFPSRKSIEEFDFDHARGLKRDTDRPPRHPGLRHRPRERGVPRPTRHREDPPGHRAGHPGLPGRAPGAVRHRQPVGRTPRRRPRRRPATDRTRPPRPLPAARHRRGRLHPVRTRSREPVLPTRLLPLRTGLPHRHLQTSRSAAGARPSATTSSPLP